MNGKNFVPSKSLNAVASYKQWEDIELPSTKRKMNELDEAKTYTKTVITTKNVQVGEVLDEFRILLRKLNNIKTQNEFKLRIFKMTSKIPPREFCK